MDLILRERTKKRTYHSYAKDQNVLEKRPIDDEGCNLFVSNVIILVLCL